MEILSVVVAILALLVICLMRMAGKLSDQEEEAEHKELAEQYSKEKLR